MLHAAVSAARCSKPLCVESAGSVMKCIVVSQAGAGDADLGKARAVSAELAACGWDVLTPGITAFEREFRNASVRARSCGYADVFKPDGDGYYPDAMVTFIRMDSIRREQYSHLLRCIDEMDDACVPVLNLYKMDVQDVLASLREIAEDDDA